MKPLLQQQSKLNLEKSVKINITSFIVTTCLSCAAVRWFVTK